MSKRKCLPMEDQKGNSTSIEKKQKDDFLTPEKAVIEKVAEPKASGSRRETLGRAVKRKVDETRTNVITRRQGTLERSTTRKADDTQPKANLPAENSPISSVQVIMKDPKVNKMILVLNRIELNFVETLRHHGVTLPNHDLTMLHSLQKPKKSCEQSCIMKTSSVDHEAKSPVDHEAKSPVDHEAKSPDIVPIVSRGNGHMIVLTEPSAEALGKPKNETNQFNCQTTTEKSVPMTVTHVTLQSDTGECKNKFLENLALTQIVPNRTMLNLTATKRNLRLSPPKKYSTSAEKMMKPAEKIVPSVPSGKNTTTNVPISTSNNVVLGNLPNDQIAPRNVRVVSKVRIIDLPAEDLQNLQNNKSHIQYMASKKDPCPQEVSLLRKLLLHQKRILATGKLVTPIPGQHVQGIPFLSGACMYVVQSSTSHIMPDTVQALKKVVPQVPNTKSSPPAVGENHTNYSLNLPQAKHSATEKLLELAINNRCDYIFPDAEKEVCNRNSCALQIALLKSELNQKCTALESCNTELAIVRAELGKANEYISSLRAQLEENTHTLCSYLAASSHVNYE